MDIMLGFELEVHLPERHDNFGMGDCSFGAPEQTPWIARKTVAKELEKILNTSVKAPRVVRDILTNWAVLRENSIDHLDINNSIGVVEIVSPPLPLEKSMASLKLIFDYCHKEGLFTSFLCGLLLNISLLGKGGQPIHFHNDFKSNLIKLIDERALLETCDRLATDFTKTHYDYLIPFEAFKLCVDSQYEIGSSIDDLIEANKNYAINFEKMDRLVPYIEFRHLGGDWILDSFELIDSTVLNLSGAIQAAQMMYHGQVNEEIPPQILSTWTKRIAEYENDVRKTLALYNQLRPQLTIYGYTSPFLEIDHRDLAIQTEYGYLAKSVGFKNNPDLHLDLDNKLIMATDFDCISQKGPLSLAAFTACYLLWKYEKYSNYEFPIKEVQHILDELNSN